MSRVPSSRSWCKTGRRLDALVGLLDLCYAPKTPLLPPPHRASVPVAMHGKRSRPVSAGRPGGSGPDPGRSLYATAPAFRVGSLSPISINRVDNGARAASLVAIVTSRVGRTSSPESSSGAGESHPPRSPRWEQRYGCSCLRMTSSHRPCVGAAAKSTSDV